MVPQVRLWKEPMGTGVLSKDSIVYNNQFERS
jgi:hypothetical protein